MIVPPPVGVSSSTRPRIWRARADINFCPELPDFGLRSSDLSAAEGADLAIIVTAHPGVDHRAVAEQAQLTLDLRGVTRSLGTGAVQL